MKEKEALLHLQRAIYQVGGSEYKEALEFIRQKLKERRKRDLDKKAVSCCQCGKPVVINRKKYHCQSCFDTLTKQKKKSNCPACNGSGVIETRWHTRPCQICKGKGVQS